jgi:hypothetical protein
MSTDHHTAWQDGVTAYKQADMNVPLGQLDAVFGGSFSGDKGKLVRINNAESAHELFDSAYDVGGSLVGKPTSSLTIMRLPMARDVVFPVGLTGSKFVAGVAATAQTVFSIKKNGAEFGTATFAASGTEASFASGAGATFVPGDVLTIVAPASPDSTLGDLGWLIAGTRNDYA